MNNDSASIHCSINSSLDLHTAENTTSRAETTHFQFIPAYSAYFIIFLASLFGNSVIIHIIRTCNSMKTSINYLILNQACADLLITLSELVNILGHYDSIGNRWFGGFLGLVTCKFFLVTLFTPPVFSIWILVTIAVERFYAVTRPLRWSPISQHLKKIILSLWALSLASMTNVILKGVLIKSNEHYYCNVTNGWITFNGIFGAVAVFVPLLMIAVLYTIACYKLWSREVPGEGPNQNRRQAEAIDTARKVTRMMIVVVVLYVVCWVPLFVSIILHFVWHKQLNPSLLYILILLTVTYSALNPYVYLTFSQQFRRRFFTLFGNCQIRKVNIRNPVLRRSQSIELEQM